MERIFVAIASYRDPECQWTVKDLFEAAEHPERVHVGICWQSDPVEDAACFQEPSPRPDQTRVIQVHHSQARGACWAKAQALSLREGEEYVLLIDAHMRFAPGWDREMIETLRATGNPRAFLSTYPAGYKPPNERRFSTPRLAPVKFVNRVMSMNSVLLKMAAPMRSYLVAGGYLFAHAAMFDEVPYDPHIYFTGEEIAHAARFFTHGWDGYTPHKCLIHHYYTRTGSVRHWDDEKDTWTQVRSPSYKRVRHLLNIERTTDAQALAEIDRYGLGRARTLEQFQACIGVNFTAQVFDRGHYETLEAAQAFIERPRAPARSLDAGLLGLHLCRHGYLLVPQKDAYIGKSLIAYGEWLDPLDRFLAQVVQAGATVCEIGAGFGVRTVFLARLVGEGGQVRVAEQSARHVQVLHANLALNGLENVNVSVQRVAARAGWVKVHEPQFSSPNNYGIVKADAVVDAPGDGLTPVVTLDGWMDRPPQLLLLDAPGSARAVMAAGARVWGDAQTTFVVNIDNKDDAEAVLEALSRRGKLAWLLRVPYFNPDNYHANPDNVLGAYAARFVVWGPDDARYAQAGLQVIRPLAA